MNKKPLPTIGVDKYTFFKVNEDSVSGTEYGEAYNLKGTVEIAPTDSGGSDVFDADNGAYEASNWDTILQMPIFRRRLTQCGVD